MFAFANCIITATTHIFSHVLIDNLFFVFLISSENLNHPWQDKAGRSSGPSIYEGLGSPVRVFFPPF